MSLRSLTLLAAIGAGVLAAGACSVEPANNGATFTGGSGGVSGTTGGAAGATTGGSAGSGTGGSVAGAGGSVAGAGGSVAGAGGVAGTDGGDGSAGTGGTGGCLDDSDAGVVNCAALPYATTTCFGGSSPTPLGYQVCTTVAAHGRPDVAQAMYSCLAQISADACSVDHDTAVQSCIDSEFGQACAKSDTASTCAGYTAGCPELSTSECENALNAITDDYEAAVVTCYLTRILDCKSDFYNCLGLPKP